MIAARQRWALSLADLCLLLLGFVLILHARPDGARLAGGIRAALNGVAGGGETMRATDLFQPGEAILTPAGQARAVRFAARAGGRRVRLDSRGIDGATHRFDGWELAAARTAAFARALVQAGVARERITLSVEGTSAPGQRLELRAE